ncbi:transmembrane protein 135-like [Cryptotermes secundus]|uniref:transmembrane protein 135-like n=1 Tax=Cryptotermes secundus TaxID=105785 RepID=UPI000CD7DC18|nr:transmembrane protein 135-like [Cryptotermes secundus]
MRAMVAASKHVSFDELCSGLGCKDVYHPRTPSCLASVWDMNQRSMKGCIQLFASVYALQLILHRRKINREYLKHHAKNYARTVLAGNLASTFSVIFCCTSRRLLGGFYRYTVLFLPTMLSAFAVVLERREKKEIYLCSLITMTVEYVIRHLARTGRLQLTKLRMCASFMLLNTAAMYLMRCNSIEMLSGINYWPFIPPRVEKRSCKRREDSDQTDCKTSVCNHSGSCWRHVFQEATKYLLLGMAVQMLRVLLPQFRRVVVHPAEQLQNLCVLKNFSLAMFFGSYVGIYHAVVCLLSQLRGQDSEVHAVPAGFLAGSAFWFYPKLTTLLMVGTTVFQQLTKRGQALGVVPRSDFLMNCIFAFFLGAMFHCRIVDQEICHPVFVSMMNAISGGRDEECRAVYLRLRDNYQKR